MPVSREEYDVEKKKKRVLEFSWLSVYGFKLLYFGDAQILN